MSYITLRNSIDVTAYYFSRYTHLSRQVMCVRVAEVEPFLRDLPNMLNKGPERERKSMFVDMAHAYLMVL